MNKKEQAQLQDLCNEVKTAKRLRHDAALTNNFSLRDVWEEQLEVKYANLRSFMQAHELATADVKAFLV